MIRMPTPDDPAELIHGDCLQSMKEIPDGSVDCIVTDPPYCSGAATEAGRGSATHQGLRSETIREGRFEWFSADNMTTSGLTWLLRSMAVEADRLLTATGSMCVFCDWRMAFVLGPAMESAGFRMRNLCFWNKESFGCGTGFRPQHEVILHLSKRSPDFHAMDQGNVIEFRAKRVRSSDRHHPTEKPVDLFAELIRVTCPKGGRVLDPFAGSFSSAVAAIVQGCQYIGIEKDPGYVEVGRRRVEQARGVGSLYQPELSIESNLFAGME